MTNDEKLNQHDIERLKLAGIEYPWHPRQTLQLLKRLERAEEDLRYKACWQDCTCRARTLTDRVNATLDVIELAKRTIEACAFGVVSPAHFRECRPNEGCTCGVNDKAHAAERALVAFESAFALLEQRYGRSRP